MNYYYDLTLCFNNKDISKFYEWELDNNLMEIKKIPIFKVDEKTLINFIKYKGNIDPSFLKKIKNRTTYKKDGLIKSLSYASIITDSKFSIALLFDDNGSIIKRSCLMLEDELNTIEIGYSLKKEKIIFNKKEKVIYNNNLKQEEKMKKCILEEINKLYQNKDKNRLVYYYMEWFKECNNSISKIYKRMINELERDNFFDLNKIYNLVLQCKETDK